MAQRWWRPQLRSPRQLPEHAPGLSWVPVAAAVPALHPGLRSAGAGAVCHLVGGRRSSPRRRCPRCDAAGLPGWCCGLGQLTAAALQERACSPRSLPGAGWSGRAVSVPNQLPQPWLPWLTRGREHGDVTEDPPALPASGWPRERRGACARGCICGPPGTSAPGGAAPPRDLNAAATLCVRRRPWSRQRERMSSKPDYYPGYIYKNMTVSIP